MALSLKASPEDGFYDNLTLGLIKILNGVPRITNVRFENRPMCERAQISTWEHRHNVYLPEDMKQFYLSTDGFALTWSYQYSVDEVRTVGNINIPHLYQIIVLRENIDALIPTSVGDGPYCANAKTDAPILSGKTKIFEMNTICDLGKICLVYENGDVYSSKIYFLETTNLKWTFLADTFTGYLRMTMAHLGLPYWELCFSTCGLPSWTEQLFLLLAPHLLENVEPKRGKTIPSAGIVAAYEPATLVLDPAIFKNNKPRCSRTQQKKSNLI